MVFVCRGATTEQAAEAIGFSREALPDVEADSFMAAMIVLNGNTVSSSYSVGQDDFYAEWYFTPCPVTAGTADPIAVIRKAQSTVKFTFNGEVDGHPYWFVAADDFAEL